MEYLWSGPFSSADALMPKRVPALQGLRLVRHQTCKKHLKAASSIIEIWINNYERKLGIIWEDKMLVESLKIKRIH